MIRRPAVLSLAVLVCAASLRADPGLGFSDAPRTLIRDGRFFGKIYVARDAAPEEVESARRLSLWIRRVTGANPEVTAERPGEKGPGIYVGATAAAASEGVAAPVTISRDAFRRETKPGGRLFLVGESPRATRFAAADFVKESLGVVFLVPGDAGADWKPLRIVRLPEDDRSYVPAFAWRRFTGLDAPAERIWALDQGLGETPEMNHALWSVFDATAYAENPAMFPMRGGRRVPPSGRGGLEPQPDLANPDSAKYAARRAEAFFRARPDAPAFSLSINDNMTWDDSPAGKAALGSGRWFRNRPDYSDYVFDFMNRAARERRALPGAASAGEKYLTAYAYYHCENTPSFPVDPDVFPVLTADRSEWRDPAFAAEDAALMARWAASGVRRFGLYDYYYGRAVAAPRVFLPAEAASIKVGAKAGASLFFAELDPDWGFDGPKAWLASELLWDPAADPGRLLDRYFESGYGEAAGPMRRFFDAVEARWTDRGTPPLWIRFYGEESVCELFPSGVRSRLRASLDAAEKTFDRETYFVSGDAARRERRRLRVRLTSLSFAKFEAFAEAYEARKAVFALPDSAPFGLIVDRLATCEATGRRLAEAVARWNACAANPGAPFVPEYFPASDARSYAASLPAIAGVGPEAEVLAAKPPAGIVAAVREPFEADAFRAAAPGTWAAAKKLTIPKAPWSTNLFEAEHTRFGFAAGEGEGGSGALVVAGGDHARLTRTVAAAPGDTCGVRVRYRGKIIPGVRVALMLDFLDVDGAELGGGFTAAFPGDDPGWRTLPLARRAPPGTSAVRITLRVTGQTASDAVFFDDLEVRLLPAAR